MGTDVPQFKNINSSRRSCKVVVPGHRDGKEWGQKREGHPQPTQGSGEPRGDRRPPLPPSPGRGSGAFSFQFRVPFDEPDVFPTFPVTRPGSAPSPGMEGAEGGKGKAGKVKELWGETREKDAAPQGPGWSSGGVARDAGVVTCDVASWRSRSAARSPARSSAALLRPSLCQWPELCWTLGGGAGPPATGPAGGAGGCGRRQTSAGCVRSALLSRPEACGVLPGEAGRLQPTPAPAR